MNESSPDTKPEPNSGSTKPEPTESLSNDSTTKEPVSPPKPTVTYKAFAPGSFWGGCADGCEHPGCMAIAKEARQLCLVCNEPISYNVDYHAIPVAGSDLTNYYHCSCMNPEHTHEEAPSEDSKKGIYIG